MQDMVKMPMPRMSASAILQEHVNPEHAAHFAAVNGNTDVGMTQDIMPRMRASATGLPKSADK
jgi:hypothetical protein